MGANSSVGQVTHTKIVTSYSISYFSQKVTKVVTELQILKVTSYFGK